MTDLNPKHTEMVNDYLDQVKAKSTNLYMLTIARDGEDPVRSILYYGNAIDAAEGYNMYNDWGFAKKYLTVTLYEPSGQINKKVFRRNQAGDPAFVKQNYVDVSNVLKDLKPVVDKKIYEDVCVEIASIFGKDNWRFNPERFLENLEVDYKFSH